MLGRLEMDVESAIKAYLDISASIFKPRRSSVDVFSRAYDALKASARFDTGRFEAHIKSIVRDRLGDENALLLQTGQTKCKV